MSVLLLIRISFAQAQGLMAPTELEGFWSIQHPKPEWGKILLCFKSTGEHLSFEDARYPAFSVSLWKEREEGLRKLRDGLFSSFTLAAAVQREGKPGILWRSPSDNASCFNQVHMDVGGKRLFIHPDPQAAQDPVKELLRVEKGPVPALGDPWPFVLEGVYEYWHISTGKVFVAFSRKEPPGKSGGADPSFSVRQVREMPDLGWAIVKEGLYGGSLPHDECLEFSIQFIDGEPWMVWANPARRGVLRRNRIVTRYANGDLGVSPAGSENKYVEDGRFIKVADGDVRISMPQDFLDLPGVYEVSAPGDADHRIVHFTPDQSTRGMASRFRVESLVMDGSHPGGFRVLGGGMLPGDPLSLVTICSLDGRCLLRFSDPSGEKTEDCCAGDISDSGDFSLFGTELEQGKALYSFRKLSLPAVIFPSAPLPHAQEARQAMSESSSLVMRGNDAHPWTEEELEAVEAILPRLPPEIRFQGPVRLEFPSTPARESRSLQRSIVRGLALLYYDSLGKDKKEAWASFALWRKGFPFSPKAQNRNPEGYASALGMESPSLDFASFAEEYFLPTPYKDPARRLDCRLPGRYAFFRELFPSFPDPLADAPAPKRFRDWIDPEDVEHLEIIITTPSSASIASFAGHALLLVKRRGDSSDCRDSLVLGFVGEIGLDRANGVDGITYAWRGISGYYDSAIQEERLGDVILRSAVLENRDVQRLRLELSRSEIEALLERLWVVKNRFTYKYRFFGANCMSMLLDSLNHVLPPSERISVEGFMIPPLLALSRLAQSGRIRGFEYPEYWSIAKTARLASRENDGLIGKILLSLGPLSEGFRERARDAFSLLRSRTEVSIRADGLFREPVIQPRSEGRAAAYLELAMIYEDIHRARECSEELLDDQSFRNLGWLILGFLMNSVDRELYAALPEDMRAGVRRDSAIPERIARETLDKELYRVQSRQDNSQELLAIREAISRLRSFMDSLCPDPALYAVGRSMAEERARDLSLEREHASFSHRYYHKSLEAIWHMDEGRQGVGMSLGSSLYLGEMGDKSICALKPDMRLVLLDASTELGLEFGGNPVELLENSRIRLGSTLVDFEKVLPRRGADYSGLFNAGFGFTILEHSSLLWDGQRFFPSQEGEYAWAEGRFILNAFELGDFTHYLNLKAGLGVGSRREAGAWMHFLNLPLGMEGKIHPGGTADNAIRYSAEWESHLWPTEERSSSLSASFELGLGLDRRTNGRLFLGLEARWSFLDVTGETALDGSSMESFFALRF